MRRWMIYGVSLLLMSSVVGGCTEDATDPVPLDAGCGEACEDSGTPGEEGDTSEEDGGGEIEDTGRDPGVGGTEDTDLDVGDASDGEPDVEEDAGEDAPDAEDDASDGEPDVDEEPGDDPNEGRPVGQCNVTADCPTGGPGGPLCTRSAPGGICAGCSDLAGCASGYDCNFGSCVASCSDAADCPPGMRCGAGGRCAIQPCQGGICPDPMFGCTESGFCTRRACDEPGDCPSRTSCVSGLCIEDRQLDL